jgi:hypothetical protein
LGLDSGNVGIVWVLGLHLLGCSRNELVLFLFIWLRPPLMFGRKLKKRIETRCLKGCFGGYPVGIRRLGKKIGDT